MKNRWGWEAESTVVLQLLFQSEQRDLLWRLSGFTTWSQLTVLEMFLKEDPPWTHLCPEEGIWCWSDEDLSVGAGTFWSLAVSSESLDCYKCASTIYLIYCLNLREAVGNEVISQIQSLIPLN